MPQHGCSSGLEAGSDDVFADTSAAVGGNSSTKYVPSVMLFGKHDMSLTGTMDGIQKLSSSMGISSSAPRRRILSNPPAGLVRAREYRHGPWMERTNRRIEAENAKAETVIFEKRVFDMAKQAVVGLQGIGVRCEMTTIANTLRAACKHRAQDKEHQQSLSQKKKTEMEQACRVLDACLQFDSRRLAALLGLTVKREKTFGVGVPV